MVRAPEGYPFPESSDARGYIREHRMIMELHAGRPLSKNEVVHHINGDHLDNRIENLRIFQSNSEHLKEEWETNPAMGRW